MYYNIYNDKDNESYCRIFESKNECYHWIVNHLDLSKNWNFKKMKENKFEKHVKELATFSLLVAITILVIVLLNQ